MRFLCQSDGSALEIDLARMKLGEGGEAVVCSVPGRPQLVAKIYHLPQRTRQREAKLAVMVAHAPEDPTASQHHASLAWPVDILRDAKGFAGFLMPRISHQRPVFEFYHPAGRKQAAPLFHYGYLHRVARNIAVTLRILHERRYVVGDFNESNILVAQNTLVSLVDCDSFQVMDPTSGEVFRCPVGKIEYTPPELQRQDFSQLIRTPEHDRFGLAVLFFQMLMEGTFPYGGVYPGGVMAPERIEAIEFGHFPWGNEKTPVRPPKAAPAFSILDPDLQGLFRQALMVGHKNPQHRPEASDWEEALAAAEGRLITCSLNRQHTYGPHLANCPWCERKTFLRGRDPFPSGEDVHLGKHLAPVPNLPKPKPVDRSYTTGRGRVNYGRTSRQLYPAPKNLPTPSLYPSPKSRGQVVFAKPIQRPHLSTPYWQTPAGCLQSLAWLLIAGFGLRWVMTQPRMQSHPPGPKDPPPISSGRPKPNTVPIDELPEGEDPPPPDAKGEPVPPQTWRPAPVPLEIPTPPLGVRLPEGARWIYSRDQKAVIVERDRSPDVEPLLEIYFRHEQSARFHDYYTSTAGGFLGAVWQLYLSRARFPSSADPDKFSHELLPIIERPNARAQVLVRLRSAVEDDTLRPVLWTAALDLQTFTLVPVTARPHQKIATTAEALRLSQFPPTQHEAAKFLERHLQARNSRHPAHLQRTLASSVRWRDRGHIAAVSVVEDFQKTWAEWPQTRDDFYGELTLTEEPGTNSFTWVAHYPLRWRQEKEGQWREGIADVTARLERRGVNDWVLLREEVEARGEPYEGKK